MGRNSFWENPWRIEKFGSSKLGLDWMAYWSLNSFQTPPEILSGEMTSPPDYPKELLRNATHLGIEGENVNEGGFEDAVVDILENYFADLLVLLGMQTDTYSLEFINQQVRLCSIVSTDCVQGDALRNTGEPSRFHPLRIAVYLMDTWLSMLQEMDKRARRSNRMDCWPETRKMELLTKTSSMLIAALFHDAGEDAVSGQSAAVLNPLTLDEYRFRLREGVMSDFSQRQFHLAFPVLPPESTIDDFIDDGMLQIKIIPSGSFIVPAAHMIYGLTRPEAAMQSEMPFKRGKFLEILKRLYGDQLSQLPDIFPFTLLKSQAGIRGVERLTQNVHDLDNNRILVAMRKFLASNQYDMKDFEASLSQYTLLRRAALSMLFSYQHVPLRDYYDPLPSAGMTLIKVMDCLDNMATRVTDDPQRLAKKSQEMAVFLPFVLGDLYAYLTEFYKNYFEQPNREHNRPYLNRRWYNFTRIPGIQDVLAMIYGPLQGRTQKQMYKHPKNLKTRKGTKYCLPRPSHQLGR